MPFIGQEPQIGAYHVLDPITASATATYNLQLNGGAFSPASANHLLVSLNGVLQNVFAFIQRIWFTDYILKCIDIK